MAGRKRLENVFDDYSFDEVWLNLKPLSIQALKYWEIDMKFYSKCHGLVYDLFAAAQFPDQFHSQIVILVRDHVQSLYDEIVNNNNSEETSLNSNTADKSDIKDGLKDSRSSVLCKYYKHWSTFQRGIDCFDDIFSYANQCSRFRNIKFSVDDKEFATTNELCRHLWLSQMILRMKDPLISSVLDSINLIRDKSKDAPDAKIIRKVIDSFIVVDDQCKFFDDSFQPSFLQRTKDYYCQKAESIRALNGNCPFKDLVNRLVDIERQNLVQILPDRNRQQIIDACQSSLMAIFGV